LLAVILPLNNIVLLYDKLWLLYSSGITLIVCLGMSMIGNDDDVELE